MAEQPEKKKKIQKTFEPQYRYAHLGAIFIYVIICVILYFQTDPSCVMNGKDHWLPIIFTVECQSAQRKL